MEQVPPHGRPQSLRFQSRAQNAETIGMQPKQLIERFVTVYLHVYVI